MGKLQQSMFDFTFKKSRKSQINQAKTFLYHNKVQIIFRRKSLLKPKKKKNGLTPKDNIVQYFIFAAK